MLIRSGLRELHVVVSYELAGPIAGALTASAKTLEHLRLSVDEGATVTVDAEGTHGRAVAVRRPACALLGYGGAASSGGGRFVCRSGRPLPSSCSVRVHHDTAAGCELSQRRPRSRCYAGRCPRPGRRARPHGAAPAALEQDPRCGAGGGRACSCSLASRTGTGLPSVGVAPGPLAAAAPPACSTWACRHCRVRCTLAAVVNARAASATCDDSSCGSRHLRYCDGCGWLPVVVDSAPHTRYRARRRRRPQRAAPAAPPMQ